MKINYFYFFVFIFFILFFVLFVKTSNAQICNSSPNTVRCRSYGAPVPGADGLYFCSSPINNDDVFYCQTQQQGGQIKCGYWRTCNSGSCNDGGGKKKPNQVIYTSCSDAGTMCTFVTCASTAPAATNTPTPTPTPSCKPDGTACSGGGGNCCTKVCTNGKCGGVTPTPTPPPPPPGVDCGSCKRGGAPCGGDGSQCCSGTCKRNGTCAGGSGCGGGGGPPPPPPPPPTSPPPPPTATPLPTATPTPVPLPWYKLKDASLIGNTSINNPIPVSPLTPYDVDDPGNRYLVDNSTNNIPGVVSGQSITIGGATVSSKNWSVSGKTYVNQTTISKFIDYVKSKKTGLVNNGSIVSNKINILSGNQTISEATLSGKRPLMVIVQGNVTLTGATLNSLNEQQIIMATGTITFPVTLSTANGLYIADSLDFGTTANQGIKIIGNIIAQSSFSNARQWSNGKRPGLFIVFDPSHYIGMLDMLSTITYDWRQIQ